MIGDRGAGPWWRAAAWAGGLTLILGGVLLAVMPTASQVQRMRPGYQTPILAFELAGTPADVEGLVGPLDAARRSPAMEAFDVGNRIDFAFLLAYGGLLLSFGMAVRSAGGAAGGVVAGLAVLAAALDVLENLQLLALTSALRDGAGLDAALARLSLATWGKWGALLLAFALLAPWLWRLGKFGRGVALCTCVGVASALLAPLAGGVAHEVMAVAVFLVFLGVWWIACFPGLRGPVPGRQVS